MPYDNQLQVFPALQATVKAFQAGDHRAALGTVAEGGSMIAEYEELVGYLSHSAKVVRARFGTLRARTTPEAIRDIQALVENAELAADALSRPIFCNWTFSGDEWEVWQSTCGIEWNFEEGGPKENNMRFCCHCGKPLKSELLKDQA